MKVVVAALEDEKTALDTAKAFKDKVFSNLPAKIEVETKTVEEFISEETEE